jgi:hypothetical protein
MAGRVIRAKPSLATAGAICTAALLVAGCGSGGGAGMHTESVAKTIGRALARQRGVAAPVTCPQTVPRRRGYHFACTVHLEVGDYRVDAVVTTGKGTVRFTGLGPLGVLDTARVAQAIEASVRAQRHLSSHAICPSQVLQREGIQFGCAVALAGRGTYKVVVREVDDAGRVRFAGTDSPA